MLSMQAYLTDEKTVQVKLVNSSTNPRPIHVQQRIFTEAECMVKARTTTNADFASAHIVVSVEMQLRVDRSKCDLAGARKHVNQAIVAQPQWHRLMVMLSAKSAMTQNFAVALDSMREALRIVQTLGHSHGYKTSLSPCC